MRRRALLGAFVPTAGAAIAWACGATSELAPAATQSVTSASRTIAPTLAPAAAPISSPTPTAPGLRDAQGRFVFIETHSHLVVSGVRGSGLDFDGALAKVGPELAQHSAKLAVVMNPPSIEGKLEISERERALYEKAKAGRFVPLGGGGSLNSVIHQNARSTNVSADLMRRFAALANEHIASGAAGFGEMAVLHLSFSPQHAFEEVAADHPLWLLLAEVAARHDVPIDVHMDAMAEDGPTPAQNRAQSSLNPPTLKANVPGFERLLAHERRARFVWAHAGSDRTGQVTVALYDRLMAAHPNLYLQLLLYLEPPQLAQNPNNVVDPRGQIRPGYIELIRKYADRIVVGGDSFFAAPGAAGVTPRGDSPNVSGMRALVDKLPPDIAGKIAIDNALRVYKIKA